MENAVSLAAHAVHHLMSKGRKTAPLIKEIYGVIVGVGNQGEALGDVFVMLFEPNPCVNAIQAVVEIVAKGIWALPSRLKERGFPIG